MRIKIKLGVIQTTRDYDIFTLHDVNRVLSDENGFIPRADLSKSMARDGFWDCAPISCIPNEDGGLTIVDGHNRFVTAKFHGLPISYFVSPVSGSPSPIEFSTSQKSWKQGDIARGFSQAGKEDYAEVVAFSEQTGVALNAAFSLFWGDIASSHNCYPNVKDGTYRIKNREAPWKVAQLYTRIVSITPEAKTLRMVHALSKCLCVKGFDKEILVDRIRKNPRMVVPCRTVEDCIEMLEEIYNRGWKKEKYYLSIEVEKAMQSRNAVLKHKAKANRETLRAA